MTRDYREIIREELRKGPKLRFELVNSINKEKKAMSIKKLEKTLAEMENDDEISRKPAEIPGTRKYTSLYALKEDSSLMEKYKPTQKRKTPGRKPKTLEGLLKRAIPKLKDRFKRNPTKEEIAIEVSRTPREIEKPLFKLAKELKWAPPRKVPKIKKDEYAIYSDKKEYLKEDTKRILKKLGFSSFKTVKSTITRTTYSILSTVKEINLKKLGFPRTLRFLIDFLGENWDKNKILLFRVNHKREYYHDPKYNNIWIEISYGRFQKSLLKTPYKEVPYGHTIIPIAPSLTYFGPDKKTYIFRDMDLDSLSKLKYISAWINDKRLSNEAIRDRLYHLRTFGKNNAIKEEFSSLAELYGSSAFDISSQLDRSSWFGPGFFIHNVKSKEDLRENLSKMLEWIEENGDWL